MKRTTRSLARLASRKPLWPAVLALAVLSAAAPAASAQAVDQRYDPANVNSRLNDPVFQRRMARSARSAAENMVGRPANATELNILGQFDQVQSQALQQIQNTLEQMPGGAVSYAGQEPQLDARTVQTLSQTPEGRMVLEEIRRQENGRRLQQAPRGRAPQNDYDRLYQQAYPDGMQGPPPSQYQNGYAPPQSSTGRALGGALLQDITNAAIQRSIGPRVQVQPYRGQP